MIAKAQTEPPQFVTVDGRLYDSTMPTNPLLDASVALRIQVLNPAKTCILYEEQQAVNTLAANGYFNVRVGSPTSGADSLKRSSNDSGNTMMTVFQNQNSPITGKTSSGIGCSYTPSSGDARYFRFVVTPSTTGVTTQLSPDMTIDSVPQALVAESLQGLSTNDFVQISANVTQAKLESLLGSSYATLTGLLAGTSSLYLQNTVNGTVMPSRPTNPAAPVAGQIWYDSDDFVLRYYDGTSVITLSTGGGDPTKLPLAGGTMTGAIAMGSNDITAVGHITQSAQRTFRFGGYTGGQETTLIATPLTAGQEGTAWYNTTTDKLMYWDGIGSQTVLTVSSANSLVPNCTATQSLQMSAGPVYVWSCVTTTDGTKLPLAGGALTGAVTTTSSITMNAQNQVRYADAAGGEYAAIQAPTTIGTNYVLTLPTTVGSSGQVLQTDGTGVLSWIAIPSAPVSSVFGRTGAVVATAGDYTATQVTNTAAGNIAATNAQAAINELDTEKVAKAGDTMTGQLTMTNNITLNTQNQVRYADAVGGEYAAIQAPTTIATNYTLTLPADDGSSGQYLQTDGSGVLTWVTPAGVGETNTASNQGVGGVGLFDAKSTFDLQFRNINAASNKVTVALDAPNKEVDINVNEANFNLASIPNTAAGNIAATNAQAAINELDTEKVAKAGDNMTGALTIDAQNQVRYADAAGGEYAAIQAPTTIGTNYVLTLPATAGSSGQVLQTNGAGVLSWVSGGSLISADSLNFTEFADAMILDASTDIAVTGTNVLSVTNSGTGNSFVVNDQAGDTSPFIIDASGNVGIGTSSPSGPLHLGAVGASTGIIFGDADTSIFENTDDDLRIILGGVDRWSFAGSILQSTRPSGVRLYSGATPTSEILLDYSAVNDTDTGIFFPGSNQLAFVTGATEKFRYAASGFAIGTTSATTLLDVAGAITSRPNGTLTGQTGQLIMRELAASPGGTDTVTIRAPDSIGTSFALTLPIDAGSSGQLLQTNGTGTLSWTSVTANGLLPSQTGNSGRFLTTDGTNTSWGLTSVDALSDGILYSTSMFVGTSAGAAATGTQNTGFGYQALQTVTTGTHNSAFGTTALRLNTGGSNTAVGSLSLAVNSTGGSNTAVGRSALGAITTTDDNTAVGTHSAGTATGASNTAVGSSALRNFVTGDRNVALGTSAGQGVASVSSGSYNTLLGFSAGSNLELADNNTFVGASTGASVVNGDGNIIIGYNVNLTGDLSNQLNIGNTIYGNLSTDAVGIGTSSPGTALDVVGAITSRPNGTGTGQTGQLIMRELAASPGGTDTVTIRAPDSVGTSFALTLPDTVGSSGQVLQTNGTGTLSWVSGGSLISADSLNFTEFADAMTLDASTDIAATGTNVLSITNSGTGNSFVVNDQASDTTPFVIDQSGNVGIGVVNPGAILHTNAGNVLFERDDDNDFSRDAVRLLRTRSSATAPGSGFGPALTFRAETFTNGTSVNFGEIDTVWNVNQTNDTTDRDSMMRFSTMLDNTASVRMVIDPNGSVGINTTAPGAMLQLGTAGTSLGTMRITGSTSGFVQIQPAAAAGSWTMTLPGSAGSSGQILSTDGAGVLNWINSPLPTADSLNFTEFADAMTLDASTDIAASGTNVLSITNSGTGNSFVVNDQASDTSPFVVDASGNVGVGSTTPAAKLHVAGGNIIVDAGNSLDFSSAAPGVMFIRRNTGANGMEFVSNSTRRMFISDFGFVSIGNITAGTILDIDGAITSRPSGVASGQTGQLVMRELAASPGGTDTVTIRAPDSVGASFALTLPDTAGSLGQVLQTNGTGTLSWVSGGSLISADSLNFTEFADAMTLDASTDIAVGTNVFSVTNDGAGNSFVVNDNTSTDTTPFVIDASGNVGIGTTAPSLKLHVQGGSITARNGTTARDITIVPNSNTLATGAAIQTVTSSASGLPGPSEMGIFPADGNGMHLLTGTGSGRSIRMTVLPGGNVGVGTTTPAALLQVGNSSTGSLPMMVVGTASGVHQTLVMQNVTDGQDQGPSIVFRNTSNDLGQISSTRGPNSITSDMRFSTVVGSVLTEQMRINTSGNVGIGTTNPGAMLQLGTAGTSLGTLRMTGNTSGFVQVQPSAAAGSWTMTLPGSAGSSGQVLQTDGAGNLSWVSGGSLISANSLDFDKFANAMTLDASTDIAASGTNVLSITNSGTGNSFVVNDQASDTSPFVIDQSGNVGIGSSTPGRMLDVAGDANINGVRVGLGNSSVGTNLAVGVQALNSNTSGTTNSAFGWRALFSTNTGGSNTGIGYGALYTNGGGGSNTAVGYAALYTNASSDFNTAVGTESLNLATGARNTGIGYRAGYQITTGSNNVVIGSNGGSSIATSSNNILMSDGSGNERFRIDSGGRMGIGSTAPRSALDVNGAITGAPSVSVAAATVNFNANNIAHTTQDCGAFALWNMRDGASYTFVVQGTNSATCSFTAFSDAGVTSLTVKMPVNHGATTALTETVYNFIVVGTKVYVAWTPGY